MDLFTDKESINLVEKVIEYCMNKCYPVGATKNEKRVICRKAERFEVTGEGELLYLKKNGVKVYIHCIFYSYILALIY